MNNNSALHYTLADLLICANAATYDDDGEVLVSGIGLLPRLAGSLAMKTSNPQIMMTDSEAWVLSEPNPVGKRNDDYIEKRETWMGFSRIFDLIWGGRRHITGCPSQIDQYGQTNISCIGDNYQKPKSQLLGVRGFPGNSISHANSYFIAKHNKRVFVNGECDMVCTIGYNPKRLVRGHFLEDVDLRRVITNLCVLDFGGPNYQMRIVSLHPGVTIEQVVDNTSFELNIPQDIPITPTPTVEQLAIIRALDPHNLRSKQLVYEK